MIFKVVLNGTHVLYDGNMLTGILDPQLEIEINAAGSFVFTLPADSDYIDVIMPFSSEIDVYEDEEMIWFGRVLNKEKLWNNQCKITCEGGLAYFNDSIQDKKTWESTKTGDVTMAMFFRDLIEWHNGQVSDDRQWEVGTIAPEFGLEKIWRETNRETTSDCLQSMCLDTNGGYLITRKEYVDDPTEGRVAKRYIDWLDEMPYSSTQHIMFGLNLLDISNSINGADICTVLVPIGADELTINKVPDTGSYEHPVDGCYHKKNLDTVIFAASEAIYGRVQKTKTWNDITDKESLYAKAVEYLKEQNTNIPSIECSAAELHYLPGYEGQTAFRVGQLVRVASDVHGIVGNYPLLKISMSLNSGAKRVTIGTPPKKELTDIVKNTGGSSSRNTSGGSSGESGGSGYVGVKDVRLKKPGDVEYESTVKNKVSKIDLSDMVKDVKLNGTSVVTEGQALLPAYPNAVEGNPLQQVDSGDLRKIKIGNHVFSIPEGGGSGGGDSDFEIDAFTSIKRYSDTRYKSTLIIPSNIDGNYKTDEYYIGKRSDLINYDAFVIVIDESVSEQAAHPLVPYDGIQRMIFTDQIETIDWYYNNNYHFPSYATSSVTQFEYGFFIWIRDPENPSTGDYYLAFKPFHKDLDQNWLIYGIYGIKFGGGGGVKDILVDGVSIVDPTTKTADFDSSEFGTTVEANPSDTPTDDLTTIKIGDTVYDIPGGSGGGGAEYLSDYYSTEERVVGRWTDGKPLYQKTYDFGTDVEIGNSHGVDLSSYVNNRTEYEQIVYCLGYGTNNSRYADPFYLTKTNNDELLAWCAEGMTARGMTVQYTKAADAPGTGPTPGNIIYLPAMYSEEEREIGVWIDGKPLYQLTFDTPALSNLSWNDFYISNLSDIETFVDSKILVHDITSDNVPWEYTLGSAQDSDYESQLWHDSNNPTHFQLYIRRPLFNSAYATITIQYTKTTDQPGSGIWGDASRVATDYDISMLQSNFQDGVDSIYDACVTKGSTPASKSLSDVVQGVLDISSSSGGLDLTNPLITVPPEIENIFFMTNYNSSGKVTSIPANTGKYYLLLTLWKNGTSYSGISSVTNGTYQSLAYAIRGGQYFVRLHYLEKEDETAAMGVSYSSVDSAYYVPIAEPLNYDEFISCGTTPAESFTIPVNNKDFIIVALEESITTGAARILTQITGASALRIMRVIYSTYHVGEIYIIFNNKESDITLTLYNNTCMYMYALLNNT